MIRSLSALALAGAAAALAFAGGAHAQECHGTPSDARLDVYVEGVREVGGLMSLTLYPDDRGKWLQSGGSLTVVFDPAQAPTTHMCVWLPGPGAYAVGVYHDANSNHRFDHTAVFPQEGYAFSNNAKATFGLPSFASARFAAKAGDNVQHILLKYP